MDKNEKYEKMYSKLVSYEQEMHKKNQRRISIGLKCILIVPLIFLILLFWTSSNKVVFLILWIVSLFAIASYLILVEYADYNLQEKLKELGDDETKEVDALIGQQMEEVEDSLKNVIQRLDSTFNSTAETEGLNEQDAVKQASQAADGKTASEVTAHE